MLKKPNLTTEEKTRLKNEILSAIDEGKKLPAKAGFVDDAAAVKKIQPDIKINQPVKKLGEAPASIEPPIKIAEAPVIAEPAVEKNKIVIETKAAPKAEKIAIEVKAAHKTEKKESKKRRRKHRKLIEVFPHKKQKAFEMTPEIKVKIKDRQEKHRPDKGLSMLHFIILLLVLIIALLVANLFMLAR